MTSTTSVIAAVLLATATGADLAFAQDFPLTDPKGLVEHNARAEAVDAFGRKAVRLISTGKGETLAFLQGVEFQDGTIEADVAAKVQAPPGVRMPGFIGVVFRARPDGSGYEQFYIRPGNSRAEDQAMRNHVVQYAARPGFIWYDLRRGWPWVYEAHAAIEPDAWTRLKIDVAGRTARLYLNNSKEPTLIVDGLKGEDLRGAVALSGSANQESYFSNVRVTSAAPQPVKNGSDAAGRWQVKMTTDAGGFDGTLQLRRDGPALSGTWSGSLGSDLPVTGTWREGYVELSFTGQWPKELAVAPAAPVKTTLAGWIDGTAGKGRMKIEGRADGQWTATRTP